VRKKESSPNYFRNIHWGGFLFSVYSIL